MNNNQKYLKDFIFPPRILTEIEKQEMDKKSEFIISFAYERKEFFDLLFNFFNSENFSEEIIKKYHTTYWVWFVKVAYKTINQINPNDLSKFFVQSLPMAFALNVNVSSKFLNYLYIAFPTPAKRNEFGRVVGENIKNSNYPINIFSTKQIDFKTLVQKVNIGVKEKKPVNAILFGKIENGIFKNTKANRDTSEKMDITNNFVNFITFFLKIKDFNSVVNKYFRALEGDKNLLEEVETEKEVVVEKIEEEVKKVQVVENKVKEVIKKQSLDYKKIKDEIVFNFGEIGKMDIAQVFDYLEEKYPNDEKVKEILYFDEEKGEFSWNDDLIL